MVKNQRMIDEKKADLQGQITTTESVRVRRKAEWALKVVGKDKIRDLGNEEIDRSIDRDLAKQQRRLGHLVWAENHSEEEIKARLTEISRRVSSRDLVRLYLLHGGAITPSDEELVLEYVLLRRALGEGETEENVNNWFREA